MNQERMSKEQRTRACPVCQKMFVARRSQIESGNGKFCSHRCAFDGGAYSKLFTPEVQSNAAERRRESVALNGTLHKSGKDNPCWKGGRDAHVARKREEYNKKSAIYRAENPDKRAATLAKYVAKNLAKIVESRAKWNTSNKEKKSALGVAWRAKNTDLLRIYGSNRRSRVKKCGGVLSKDLSKKLLGLQNGKCACCSQPLGARFHMDHIMPIALGGSNTDDNIQLLRSTCNQQKHAKHPIDFMQGKGFLL